MAKMSKERVSAFVANKINQRKEVFNYESKEIPRCLIFVKDNTAEILSEHAFNEIVYDQAKVCSASTDTIFEDITAKMECITPAQVSATGWRMLNDKKYTYPGVIKMFGFKSDHACVFHRIAFDPVKGPCPTWDALLNNFTNQGAVRAFIGSLFSLDADRSQYLWLYGEGGNGKSTMIRIFEELLGEFAKSVQPEKNTNTNPFFTFTLINKRLVIIDDCENAWFVKSGIFKQITGGAKVSVEQKFKTSSQAALGCKFMFTSNKEPMISRDRSDMRRIIFSEGLAHFECNLDVQRKLKAELPQFLNRCIQIYNEHCPNHEPIRAEMSQVEDIANSYHSIVDDFIFKNLNENESSEITRYDLSVRFKAHNPNLDVKELYRELRKRGFSEKQKRIGGKPTFVFTGISLVNVTSFN